MGFGKVMGDAFSTVGKDLAIAAGGIGLLGLVIMGLYVYWSIIDNRTVGSAKSAGLKLLMGSAIIGASGVASVALGRIAAAGGG